MVTYIVLLNYTEQGIKAYKDTGKRADKFKQAAKAVGATTELYWTLGQYDLVSIVQAPDDETVAGLLIKLGALGNVRTQALRAFSRAEIDAVIGGK